MKKKTEKEIVVYKPVRPADVYIESPAIKGFDEYLRFLLRLVSMGAGVKRISDITGLKVSGIIRDLGTLSGYDLIECGDLEKINITERGTAISNIIETVRSFNSGENMVLIDMTNGDLIDPRGREILPAPGNSVVAATNISIYAYYRPDPPGAREYVASVLGANSSSIVRDFNYEVILKPRVPNQYIIEVHKVKENGNDLETSEIKAA